MFVYLKNWLSKSSKLKTAIFQTQFFYQNLIIHNEIARPGLSSLASLASLGSRGQPSGLVRPGWPRPCPGRPGWLDLDALGAPGSPWLVRCGLEWLDLRALGALAGSLWTPRAILPRPGWPTIALSTRLAKKIDLLIDDPASMLPASCALECLFMPQI